MRFGFTKMLDYIGLVECGRSRPTAGWLDPTIHVFLLLIWPHQTQTGRTARWYLHGTLPDISSFDSGQPAGLHKYFDCTVRVAERIDKPEFWYQVIC